MVLLIPVLFPELTQQAALVVHNFFFRSIERYAYPLGAALNADLTQQLLAFAHIVRHPLVGSADQDTPAFFWLDGTVNSISNISFREQGAWWKQHVTT